MLQKWRKTTHLVSDNGIFWQLCENKMSIPVSQVYFLLWILLTNASILFWKSDVLLLFSLKCLFVRVIRSDYYLLKLIPGWESWLPGELDMTWEESHCTDSSSACLSRSGRAHSRWFPGNMETIKSGKDFQLYLPRLAHKAVAAKKWDNDCILHCWKCFMMWFIIKSY